MQKYILLILISLFLFSCKAANGSSEPVSTTKPIAGSNAFFAKITKKPDFQQLKINSKVDVQTGSFIPTLDATIYIENGQKVWMNMVALFINAGRGIATPAGIQGYERLNKTYIESDYSYLNNLLNVNFIDYSSLQNLLMGKTFVPVNEKDFVLTQNAQGYQLASTKNLKFGQQGKLSEYEVMIQYSAEADLLNLNLKNVSTSDVLAITYSNWMTFEGMRLPKNVKIDIKGTKSSQILLENTKFETSKMSTPYTVPNNYTKTEIR